MLIKPDGVQRRVIGEIIGRIERKGLTIAALELKNVSEELARAHYAEHADKPFFGSLLEFITSGPVVAAVLEGPRAIAAFRQLAGGTDPVEKATPGTIRGDLGLETQFNLVHGSDSPESAAREIELWFPGRLRPSQPGVGPDRSAGVGYWRSDARQRASTNETSDVRDHRSPRCGADRQQPSFSQALRAFSEPSEQDLLTSPGTPGRIAEALAWPRRQDAPGGLRRLRGRR